MTFPTTSTNGSSNALARLQQQIKEPLDPSTSFPCMVHQCLTDIEALEQRDPSMGRMLSRIIGWQRQGTVFRVHDKKKFQELIMPVWFIRLKYTSFVRQLTLYGFKKIQKDEAGSGLQKGAMYHELFLQGQPELVKGIGKVKGKQSSSLPGLPPSPPGPCPLQDPFTASSTTQKFMTRMSMSGGMIPQDPPSPSCMTYHYGYGDGSTHANANANGLVHLLAPARSMTSVSNGNGHGDGNMQAHFNPLAATMMYGYSNNIMEERNQQNPEEQMPELDVSDLLHPDLPKVDFSFLDLDENPWGNDASLSDVLEPTPFGPTNGTDGVTINLNAAPSTMMHMHGCNQQFASFTAGSRTEDNGKSIW